MGGLPSRCVPGLLLPLLGWLLPRRHSATRSSLFSLRVSGCTRRAARQLIDLIPISTAGRGYRPAGRAGGSRAGGGLRTPPLGSPPSNAYAYGPRENREARPLEGLSPVRAARTLEHEGGHPSSDEQRRSPICPGPGSGRGPTDVSEPRGHGLFPTFPLPPSPHHLYLPPTRQVPTGD